MNGNNKVHATKRKSVLENANTLAGKELGHRYRKEQLVPTQGHPI